MNLPGPLRLLAFSPVRHSMRQVRAAAFAAVLFAPVVLTLVARAQVTDSGSQPVLPTTAPKDADQNKPQQQGSTNSTGSQQQKAAPIERRASKPGVGSLDPVAGPIGAKQSGAAQGADQQPVNRSGPVETGRPIETIRVNPRLVNVALNVVDAKGSPVGGFEKSDFRLFEDGRTEDRGLRARGDQPAVHRACDRHQRDGDDQRTAGARGGEALCHRDRLDLIDFADTVREVVAVHQWTKRVEQGLELIQCKGDETALYNAVYLASQRLGGTWAGTAARAGA